MRTCRHVVLPLIALGLAGCNALLGLGGSPTAEEASAGGGLPTTTAATGTGGGTAPSSSSSGTAGHGGAGGDGAGGGGGGGGGEGGSGGSRPACGPCDDDAGCGPGGVCAAGGCAVRVLPLAGGERLVEGVAVSPTTIVVGVADGAQNVTFHFVDRVTWQPTATPPQNVPIDGVLAPGPDLRAYYAPNGSAVVLPIDPDGFAGPIAVVDALRGLTFDPGPTPDGSLLGVAWSDGRVVRVDLAAPSEACPIAGPQGDAAADLAVRRDPSGAATSLGWSLTGMLGPPVRVDSDEVACDASGEVRTAIEGADALGTITLGDTFVAVRAHLAGEPGGTWTAWSSAAAATRPTNAGWGLTADADRLLVPGVDAGLDRCSADLAACEDASPSAPLGAVQDVAIAGDALLIADVVASAPRLVCLARTDSAPR